MLELIDLVEDMEDGDISNLQIGEHLLHHLGALLPPDVRNVDDMQEEVRFSHFLERRSEGRHEMVRQLADEANRVGEQYAIVLAEIDLTRERVERREQAVFNENITRA